MSKIEWCDETINPVVGCRHISPACDHCYAERMALRGLTPAHAKATRDGQWTGKVVWQFGPLRKLAKWKKPRRVFVGSMTDLALCSEARFLCIWHGLEAAPWHTYMLLTKRPRRLGSLIRGVLDGRDPPPWLWVGVTAEDQQRADERIPELTRIPAAVRFVSCEPLLGPIYLRVNPWEIDEDIQWVIAGGESGPGARPMHPDWARGLRDQCVEDGVPFFFKQWGEWVVDEEKLHGYPPDAERTRAIVDWTTISSTNRRRIGQVTPVAYRQNGSAVPMKRIGKKAAGREIDGRTWDEMPEVER